MRLGYNTSSDGGLTWGTPRILPGPAVDRNHPQVCMTANRTVHVCWRQGDGADDPVGYITSPDAGNTVLVYSARSM
jgi:hypothetical protein